MSIFETMIRHQTSFSELSNEILNIKRFLASNLLSPKP